MHIPDGILSTPVLGVTSTPSALYLGVALHRSRGEGALSPPILGATAAFLFATQLFHFPIWAGTSGHFLGALFAMILLGPFGGGLVTLAVLTLQALLMGHGGLFSLGTNAFNLALVAGVLPYLLFLLGVRLFPPTRRGFLLLTGALAWLSVVLGALALALELSLSEMVPLNLSLASLGGVHAFIGLGESFLTFSALGFLLSQRPDLIHGWQIWQRTRGAFAYSNSSH